MFAGVAAGIAEYQQMSVFTVRLCWIVLFGLTGGLALAAYIILAFLMPPPDDFDINDFRQQ